MLLDRKLSNIAPGKRTNTWKQNNILLKNHWAKKKMKEKKYKIPQKLHRTGEWPAHGPAHDQHRFNTNAANGLLVPKVIPEHSTRKKPLE